MLLPSLQIFPAYIFFEHTINSDQPTLITFAMKLITFCKLNFYLQFASQSLPNTSLQETIVNMQKYKWVIVKDNTRCSSKPWSHTTCWMQKRMGNSHNTGDVTCICIKANIKGASKPNQGCIIIKGASMPWLDCAEDYDCNGDSW